MMSSQQQQAGDSRNFSAGLRVLVVDDDPEFLKGIENNLKNINYEVTTCGSDKEGIDLLELVKEGSQVGFDLALCGVNKTQTNGIGFTCYAGLFEPDLPIIMMSDYGDEAMVKVGCQLGTTHHIYKPIQPRQLSCIWQHAYRRRLRKKMTAQNELVPPLCEGGEALLLNYEMVPPLCEGGEVLLLNYEAVPPLCEGGGRVEDTIATSSGNKRNAEADVDPRPAKKGRFIWTDERHRRFVAAFEKLGDKATPGRIMAEMNMPGLTRNIVSSHLQKYKQALDRAQHAL